MRSLAVLLSVGALLGGCQCGTSARDGGLGGGAPGTGGGAGGGAAFSCSGCPDGSVCIDGASCEASCPTPRVACAGGCCASGARCCALDETCAGPGEACPALCPDGMHVCPENRFCQAGACLTACPAGLQCAGNGCCAAGSTCVDGGCELPDLEALPPLRSDAGLLVERRNFDPAWCEVTRNCVHGGGEHSLLHFEFRIANVGLAPADLTRAPGSGLLAAACVGDPATTLKAFARWELSGLGDGGVLADGASDVHCLRDDAPLLSSSPPVFTCTAQGLSPGFVSDPPTAGVCTAADVSGFDAGTYSLTVTVNPTGRLPEVALGNNQVTFPIVLPDTSCRGRLCGTECCPPNTGCNAAGSGCALPDLIVDEAMLAASTQFSTETFPMNDCAIAEGCLLDGGTRRLLRFTTSTPNVGEADFYIGDPALSPNAMFDTCHGHYHYHQYAQYRLLLADAGTVVVGRKQAFCALDLDPYWPDAGPAKYDCQDQGVTVGWADTYDSSLDCQWIDVTDVPPGDYVLEVDVNPAHYIAEKDYSNNVARVPVFVPPADGGTCAPQPEICANGLDENCDGVADDGCPPLTANDTCALAHDVGRGGEFTAQIGAGTAADVSVSCGGAGADLFFKLHLMAPELVYLSTYGSSIDTVLAVFDGLSCGTERACTDDGCGLLQSHTSAVLPAGDYVIAVKAKSPGATGLVKLDVQVSPCTQAQLISGPATLTGNTTATANDFTSRCAGGGGKDELWYLVSCPSASTLTAETCGTQFDTVLSVKQGSCRAVDVTCDDDSCAHQSQIAVGLPRAGLYFLIVDGYDSSESGPYSLAVSW